MTKFKKVFEVLVFSFIILCLGVTGTQASSYETYVDFEYDVLDDGTVEITKYMGSTETIDIPGEIDGRRVKQISSLFSDGCENPDKHKYTRKCRNNIFVFCE